MCDPNRSRQLVSHSIAQLRYILVEIPTVIFRISVANNTWYDLGFNNRTDETAPSMRNPSDKPQTFSLDIQTALESPAGAAHAYTARDPWKPTTPALTLHPGHATQIDLQPWEVRTLEATPSGRE
jgi:hypothetical protein